MATYYIDFAGGSNSNAGTSTGAPWKHCPGDANATGTPASTTLSAGDTVAFKGGVVYLGQLVVSVSGSSGNLITFDGGGASWGAGRAVIDAEYALNGECIHLAVDVDYVTVTGFELRNAGGYAEDDPVVLAAANGDYGNGADAIKTPRPGYGVHLAGTNDHITLSNLYIHNIGIWYSTIGWDGLAASGMGIRLTTPSNTVVSSCEITKVGATGIGLYSAGTCENVLFTGLNVHDDLPNWGFDIAPQSIGAVFNNIKITESVFRDLWSDWTGTPDSPPTTTAPHQNYIFFRTSTNVSTWTDVEVSRCLFTETSDTHTGLGGTGSIFISNGPSVNIYNNVFARPWSYSGQIFIYYDVPASMTQECRIYNNTFLRGSGSQVVISGATAGGGARLTYIENNILINETGLAANAVMLSIGNSYNYPASLNRNIYWAPNWNVSQKYIATLNGAYKTLATLRDAGFEANGQYDNPDLIDAFNATPASRDFRLTEASRAIGAGSDMSAYFTTDYAGSARASWDVGAYEYDSGAPPPASTPNPLAFRSNAMLAMGVF